MKYVLCVVLVIFILTNTAHNANPLKNVFDVLYFCYFMNTDCLNCSVLAKKTRWKLLHCKYLFNILWVATHSYYRTTSAIKSTIAAGNSSICPLSLNAYFMFTTWNCKFWINNIYFVADEISWRVSTSKVHSGLPGHIEPLVQLNSSAAEVQMILRFHVIFSD